MFEKTQGEVLQEMNDRQKAMQREENYRAERAEEKARYNRLSPHEKKYYHEPNELAFQLLVQAYQKDEYSLEESIEFAYNDYIGDHDDAITPREKRVGAAWEKIATDYRNSFFIDKVSQKYKKKVKAYASEKGVSKKQARHIVMEEFAASEDEFDQKYANRASSIESLMESKMGYDEFVSELDNHGLTFSEKILAGYRYKPLYTIFMFMTSIILFVFAPIYLLVS